MEFITKVASPEAIKTDAIGVGIYSDGSLSAAARRIDTASGGAIKAAIKSGDATGKRGNALLLRHLTGVATPRVVLVGLGAPAELTDRGYCDAVKSALKNAGSGARQVALAAADWAVKGRDTGWQARMLAVAARETAFRTDELKSKKDDIGTRLTQVALLLTTRDAQAERGLAQGVALANGMELTKRLGNLPGNVCTPTYLAEQAQRLGERHANLKVRVLEESEIRAEKMGCFLSVTAGSEQPPRFIVMEYKSARAPRAPIVLVGKGITFDTGGISLKDPGGMDEMKFDMSGAAAVVGAMSVVAELQLPLNVVALIPTCENMPSGNATKPGDIVTSAAGLTVEILNTDAEGRLILCDALHYARRYKPQAVIDLATLTGACVIALGHHHSGVMANDDDLAQELVSSGLRADDRAWHLPCTEEYAEQLKSNFADLANVAGRDGGALTAAAFLGKFTAGMRWAHMDIAGSAYVGGANKGSTGRPVALLADFLIRRAAR